LSQTRLAKRLTIDEVAHATKLRPDKIVALENDDFSRFGSLAYGKGFLQIYARYLGVDISDQLRGMESPEKTVSIAEYQYLNSPAPEKPSRSRAMPLRRERREHRERRAPSVLPLVIVLGLGIAGIYGFYRLNAPRLGLDRPTQTTAPTPAASPDLDQPAPVTPEAKPEVAAPNVPASPPVHAKDTDAAFLADANARAGAAGTAARVAAADDSQAGMNELIVEPLKKTWVRIHKDSPDSPPIFEDYLYPGVRPLKLRGARFFVEVRDQSAVQIRKNGHPIAYQSPGISIQ